MMIVCERRKFYDHIMNDDSFVVTLWKRQFCDYVLCKDSFSGDSK